MGGKSGQEGRAERRSGRGADSEAEVGSGSLQAMHCPERHCRGRFLLAQAGQGAEAPQAPPCTGSSSLLP